MSQEWGRGRHAGEWPNRHAVWTWMAVFVALVSMAGICLYRYAEAWTPLQRFYVKTYIRSDLRSVTSFAKSDRYQMLTVITKKGSHWASEGEVTEVKTESGETTLALTDDAVKIGDLRLVLPKSGVKLAILMQICPKNRHLPRSFLQQLIEFHKSSFSLPTVLAFELDARFSLLSWQ